MSAAVQCDGCERFAHVGGDQTMGWKKLLSGLDMCPECWDEFIDFTARKRNQKEGGV